jgi:tetratricopeptide (TPR) repeat protein
MMRRVFVACALLWALDAAPALAAPSKSPAAKAQEERETELAREHVARAKTHFKLGEFEPAIQEFKEAYRLRSVPGLLFNIAQANRMLGRYPEAKRLYENYLRDLPDAANREEVLRQIQQLDELIAAGSALPPSSPDAAGTDLRPPSGVADAKVAKSALEARSPPTGGAEEKPARPSVAETKAPAPAATVPAAARPTVAGTKAPAPAATLPAAARPTVAESKAPAPGAALPAAARPTVAESKAPALAATVPQQALQPAVEAASVKVPAIAVAAGAVLLGAASAVVYGLASAGWESAIATERPRPKTDRLLKAADELHSTSLALGAAAAVTAVGAGFLFVF